jgi:hypothetical protein
MKKLAIVSGVLLCGIVFVFAAEYSKDRDTGHIVKTERLNAQESLEVLDMLTFRLSQVTLFIENAENDIAKWEAEKVILLQEIEKFKLEFERQ